MRELFNLLLGIAITLLTDELSDHLPRLARSIVLWCSWQMPLEDREAYMREHSTELDLLDGKLTKLLHALSLFWGVWEYRAELRANLPGARAWQRFYAERVSVRLPQNHLEWGLGMICGIGQLFLVLNTLIVGSPVPMAYMTAGYVVPMLVCFGAAALAWTVRLSRVLTSTPSPLAARLERWAMASTRVVGGGALVSLGVWTVFVMTLAVMNAEAQTFLPAWFAISCLFLPTFAFQAVILERVPTTTVLRIPLRIVQRAVCVGALGFSSWALCTIAVTAVKSLG